MPHKNGRPKIIRVDEKKSILGVCQVCGLVSCPTPEYEGKQYCLRCRSFDIVTYYPELKRKELEKFMVK